MSRFDDDELRAMLGARADRASFDPESMVAEGRRRSLEAATSGTHARRGWPVAAFGGLAVAAAVVVLVVVPLAFRPAASTVPGMGQPTPTVSDGAPTPSPRLGYGVTAAELDPAMGDTTGFVGLTIAFQGALVADPTPCPTGNVCGLLVAGLSRPHTLVAPEGQLLPALPASGRIEGTFAIRFTERIIDDGRMVFEDVGQIVPAADGLTWPIPILAAGGPDLPTGLIAATGSIWSTAVTSCPSVPGGACAATADFLAIEVQPGVGGGSSADPPTPSMALTPGSLAASGSVTDPERDGKGPATLLLRLVKGVPCALPSGGDGSTIVCPRPQSDTWQVVGRLDPPLFVSQFQPPGPAPLPTPKGSTAPLPPAAAHRLAGGFPATIDGEQVFVGVDAMGRLDSATDDTPFLVGGWFDSHILQTCSPPIGQADLDPLEARTCGRYFVTGIPGRPLFRDGFEMPEGAGPIVLRIHTRDPGAAACTPEGRAECLGRSVVETVVWFGDEGTVSVPISPLDARWMATTVFVTEFRNVPGLGEVAVAEDMFTVPVACPAPWPALVFSIHGDPRYGLVAVFPDPNARERFEAATDPDLGAACLNLPIERPAPARWVGHENMLVLLYADDAFATRLAEVLDAPGRPQKAISLTDPGFDRTLGTVTDYLVARAAGEIDHAWGRIGDQDANPYPRWVEDILRRQAANALVGRLEVLDEEPTEARVGKRLWRLLDLPAAATTRIVRVTYDRATYPALASEEYLVIHVPDSEYRDWTLVRIAGEPYPG